MRRVRVTNEVLNLSLAVLCEAAEEAGPVPRCVQLLTPLLARSRKGDSRRREVRPHLTPAVRACGKATLAADLFPLSGLLAFLLQYCGGRCFPSDVYLSLNCSAAGLLPLWPFRSGWSGVCRVLLCLKRALRIANAAQQQANATRGSGGPVTLFVEILNK